MPFSDQVSTVVVKVLTHIRDFFFVSLYCSKVVDPGRGRMWYFTHTPYTVSQVPRALRQITYTHTHQNPSQSWKIPATQTNNPTLPPNSRDTPLSAGKNQPVQHIHLTSLPQVIYIPTDIHIHTHRHYNHVTIKPRTATQCKTSTHIHIHA